MDRGLIEALIDISGSQNVLAGDALNSRYPHIWKMDVPLTAKALVCPQSTTELSQILSLCHRLQQPVVAHGGLTNLVGSTYSSPDELVVSFEKLNKIREIDESGRSVTVEAGVILEDIHNAVAEKDLFLPLNFGARGSAMTGGILASNAGGLRVFRYGMARAHVLGLEVVLADGTVLNSLKNIIKDNSAYDLKQLFIGTEGTLGWITAATLRLHEQPVSRQSAFAGLDDYEQVLRFLRFMDKGLGGSLSGFELIWGSTYHAMTTPPAQSRPPLTGTYNYYVLMETMGTDPDRDFNNLTDLLETALEQAMILDAVLAHSQSDLEWFWNIREDVHVLASSCPFDQHFDVSLPLRHIGKYAGDIEEELLKLPDVTKVFTFGHVADGNIHFIVGKNDKSDALRKKIDRIVYTPLQSLKGSVSAEHGIGKDKKDYLHLCRSSDEIGLMKLLKKTLDPHNILNRGRVLDV